ncbi:MAG: transcriptional regulator [Kofleriaceae bacterium]
MTANPIELTSRRADSQQLVRQWAILRLLSDAAAGRSVKDLAEQLGVSKATIQRDLATLERDFAVVEQPQGKQKRLYRLDHSVRALEAITFGAAELLAIHAALSSLHGLVGTPIHDDLRTVVTKLRGFLSARHNGGLDALAQVFAPHARGYVDYGAQAGVIDQLVDAIARRRTCTLSYFAAWRGTTRRHTARPLRLVWHRSALYLLACLGDHERITTLAVQRIRDLDVGKGEFTPPRVDVDAHTHKAFGIFVADREEDVEIHFAADVAWQLLERTFHPDEQKALRDDGVLVYKLRSSAQWEIVPWVQSYGAAARLVSPPAWRDLLARSLTAAAAQYA